MVDLGDPETRIEAPAQAIARMEELVLRITQLDNTRTVKIDGQPAATVKIQQNATQHWLMTFGQAGGTLTAYRECGLLTRGPYRVLRRKVIEAFMGALPIKFPKSVSPWPKSQDELIRYLDALCGRVVAQRDLCDVIIPDDPETTAQQQWAAYEAWNVYYGQAIGTLIAYRQCNRIEDLAFELMKAKTQATLASRVVGSIQAPIQAPRGVRLVR